MNKQSEIPQLEQLAVDELFAIKGGVEYNDSYICELYACESQLCDSSACSSNSCKLCTSSACKISIEPTE